MTFVVISLLISATMTLLALRWSSWHARWTHDHDLAGPQKVHSRAVPRIGGLGIVLGVATALLPLAWLRGEVDLARAAAVLLLCALPAFAAGFIEDLTKTQSPRRRLAFTALSALLGSAIAGVTITRTDLPGLDWVVATSLGAGLVTVFVVSGVANAVNIIDGFNGLASMCTMLMLGAIALIAREVGDAFVLTLALAGIGGVLGFFVWNFPAGLIFLGDGGAYFLGFWVAELGILLVARNPSVSPLAPLLICIYPVFETLFSIYRRRLLRGVSPGMPDGVHLHQLVYRRLVRWGQGAITGPTKTRRNSLTSPYLWALCLTSIVPALLFWNSSLILGLYIIGFALFYMLLYWRIVRFRAPRWLVLRQRGGGREGID